MTDPSNLRADQLRDALRHAVIYDSRDNVKHEPGRAAATSKTLKDAVRERLAILEGPTEQDIDWWAIRLAGQKDALGFNYLAASERVHFKGIAEEWLCQWWQAALAQIGEPDE